MQKMIIFIIVSLTSLVSCSDSGNNPSTDDIKWSLSWSDEFDEAVLSSENWNHETGGHGWGNNESQFYTSREQNSYIEDEKLVIEARKESYQGSAYTSARLTTQYKTDIIYGRVEVRAKLPEGQGIWPAIWMMPSQSLYGGWPASGEIDIMELVGHDPGRIHGTIHFGASYEDHGSRGNSTTLGPGKVFSDDYHDFSIEWEPGEIRWYLDDRLYASQNSWYTADAAYPAPFDKHFFIIFNVAVGGNWPGYPDESTVFPQKMFVEYVRIYKHTGKSPLINITSPLESEQINLGSDVEITIESEDEDGTVEKTELICNGNLVAESLSKPFTLTWKPQKAGINYLVAKCKDNDGRTGLSDVLQVFVGY